MPFSISASRNNIYQFRKVNPQVTAAVNKMYQEKPDLVKSHDQEISETIQCQIASINSKEKQLTKIKNLLTKISSLEIKKISDNNAKLDEIKNHIEVLLTHMKSDLNISEEDESFKKFATLKDAIGNKNKKHIIEALKSLSEIKQIIREKISEVETAIEDKRKRLPAIAKALSEGKIKETTLAGLIEQNPSISKEVLRYQFYNACASKRNQIIIEEMAQKEKENHPSSTATVSSATAIQPQTDAPVATTTTAKRSWIGSCLDSISTFFKRKPKTDLSLFSSPAGKEFLSKLDTHTSQIDPKFIKNFTALIKEKEKESSYRFIDNSKKKIAPEFLSAAELFKSHYQEKYEAQRKKYIDELTELERKTLESEQNQTKINAQKFALRGLITFFNNALSKIDVVYNEILEDSKLYEFSATNLADAKSNGLKNSPL